MFIYYFIIIYTFISNELKIPEIKTDQVHALRTNFLNREKLAKLYVYDALYLLF